MTRTELEAAPLADIVSDDYRTAAILDRYGLDYCCGGARSLGEQCRQKHVDLDRVVSDIGVLDPDARVAAEEDPAALVDGIIVRHHAYVRTMVPIIRQHLAKVAAKHGARYPELDAIASQFDALADDLWLHMLKEERVLFPYIKVLANAVRDGGPRPPDMFGTVQNPIRMMEIEHQHAGDEMAAIRELTHGYVAPADACTTFRLVFGELDAFEKDLHRHVHLENNVLFPKAVELEGKV